MWGEEILAEKMIEAKEESWGEIFAVINAMTGDRFGFSHEDNVLHKRWRYSCASFGLFFGLVLLLRRVMRSHKLQTVDLDISISYRWGVTAGKLGYQFMGIYGHSLICKHSGSE